MHRPISFSSWNRLPQNLHVLDQKETDFGVEEFRSANDREIINWQENRTSEGEGVARSIFALTLITILVH
jgi:hypothetical protein